MKYNSKILICMALFSTLFLGLKLLRTKIEDAKNHGILVLLKKHYDIPAPKRRRRSKKTKELTWISTKLHSRKMVQYWVIVFSKLVVLQTKVNFRKVNILAESIRLTICFMIGFPTLWIQKILHLWIVEFKTLVLFCKIRSKKRGMLFCQRAETFVLYVN